MPALILFGAVPPAQALRVSPEAVDPAVEIRSSPWSAHKEKGAYRAVEAETGKHLWVVHWQTQVTRQGDQTWVQIEEQGRGQPWRCKEPIVWEKQMVFEANPIFAVRSVEGSRWNSQGRLISRMDLRADPRRRLLLYEERQPDGSLEKGQQPLASQTFPDELLFHWARTLAFDRAPAGECQVMVSPKRRFRLRAWVRGIETVTTPAGSFSCFRVELVPRLGPLEILPLKAVMPKLTVWCTTASPHHWVRYDGPLGGPGSPYARMELVSFQQEG